MTPRSTSLGDSDPGWFNPDTGEWELDQPILPAFLTDTTSDNESEG